VAQLGVIAKIDYQRAKDALQSAQIRVRHAASATRLEGEDVALALQTKLAQLEREQLSLAEAERRVNDLTVRAPADRLIGLLNVQDRMVVPSNAPRSQLSRPPGRGATSPAARQATTAFAPVGRRAAVRAAQRRARRRRRSAAPGSGKTCIGCSCAWRFPPKTLSS
jgi:hypothetical protein